MSLLEQQNLLAKLYTDPVFRESFYGEPRAVGRELGLDGDEIKELLLVAPAEVELFSESLIWKRLQEVEILLPSLRESMGEGFRPAFLGFAGAFNPSGIRKHYEDALEFCRYIINSEPDLGNLIVDMARFESTRIQFFNEGWLYGFCRERAIFSPPGPADGKRRTLLGFVIWIRFGRRIMHFNV